MNKKYYKSRLFPYIYEVTADTYTVFRLSRREMAKFCMNNALDGFDGDSAMVEMPKKAFLDTLDAHNMTKLIQEDSLKLKILRAF